MRVWKNNCRKNTQKKIAWRQHYCITSHHSQFQIVLLFHDVPRKKNIFMSNLLYPNILIWMLHYRPSCTQHLSCIGISMQKWHRWFFQCVVCTSSAFLTMSKSCHIVLHKICFFSACTSTSNVIWELIWSRSNSLIFSSLDSFLDLVHTVKFEKQMI